MLVNGEYQKPQRDTALSHVSNFDTTAIDVGANIGLWTIDLARSFRDVVCFEPVSDNVYFLRKNLFHKLGPINNVTVHDVALSNCATERKMSVSKVSSAFNSFDRDLGESYSISVETKRLDDYSMDNIGFIKIDVEFHEEAVLRGGQHTLESCKPVLCVELVHRNYDEQQRSRKCMDLLGYMGYRLAKVHGKEHVFVHSKNFTGIK